MAEANNIYTVQAICVPRRPVGPGSRPFIRLGGYPILREHGEDQYFLAGYGDHGILIPGNNRFAGLTRGDYRNATRLFYRLIPAQGNPPLTMYRKLRNLPVRFKR